MLARRLTRLILAGLALCSPWLGQARDFEFLYVDANEGQASGGHSAIKFDDAVFHFQHVEPGLLRLFRSDFSAFRFAYGYQENRTIAGHRITVDEAVFDSLHDAFKRRLLLQNQQFAWMKALQDDYRLLSDLNQPAQKHVALKALGYFVEDYRLGQEKPVQTGQSLELAALKRNILAEYGDNFLQQKRQRVLAQLIALKPSASDTAPAIDEDRFGPDGYSFAQHYKNQLLNLAALDILEWSLSPRAGTLLTTPIAELRLHEPAIIALTGFKQTLAMDLLKLIQSEREDWGYPLLVGMARLHALQQSIDSGQWVILDRFVNDPHDDRTVRIDADTLPSMRQYASNNLVRASEALATTNTLAERDYNDLEIKAGIAVKMANAGNEQTLLLPPIDETPSLEAHADLVALPLSGNELESHQRSSDTRFVAYKAQLQSMYAYQLLRRNCVTEIFRVIHASLDKNFALPSASGPVESTAQISKRLLGGYIDAEALTVIPFAAFDRVGSQYRVQNSYRLPSYRELAIEHRYQTEADMLVDLSESNVMTSSIYRGNKNDAAFLFFTQDAVWPRPLLGTVNLSVALGQTLYGLLALPWDSGQNLQQSLKGIVVSVPELFFFNIRKGSFPRLLPTDASRDGVIGTSQAQSLAGKN